MKPVALVGSGPMLGCPIPFVVAVPNSVLQSQAGVLQNRAVAEARGHPRLKLPGGSR